MNNEFLEGVFELFSYFAIFICGAIWFILDGFDGVMFGLFLITLGFVFSKSLWSKR